MKAQIRYYSGVVENAMEIATTDSFGTLLGVINNARKDDGMISYTSLEGGLVAISARAITRVVEIP